MLEIWNSPFDMSLTTSKSSSLGSFRMCLLSAADDPAAWLELKLSSKLPSFLLEDNVASPGWWSDGESESTSREVTMRGTEEQVGPEPTAGVVTGIAGSGQELNSTPLGFHNQASLQGLFLCELTKTQFEKAKTLFESAKTQLRNWKLLYFANLAWVGSLDGLKLQSSIKILQNMGIHSNVFTKIQKNY